MTLQGEVFLHQSPAKGVAPPYVGAKASVSFAWFEVGRPDQVSLLETLHPLNSYTFLPRPSKVAGMKTTVFPVFNAIASRKKWTKSDKGGAPAPAGETSAPAST